MTANRGLFIRNNGNVGTTPIEGRLVLASLVAENAPGVPRNGLLDQKVANLVTGSASNMSYNVGPCTPVINRAAGEGVYMFTLTGTNNVATDAAPGTGSRYDLIYVKQSDLDKGDAVNAASLAVQKGTAAASPTKPYADLPAGAYVLAEALIQAGAANTADAKVTLTQAWRYTALRGAPIPLRNAAERDEITPSTGTRVWRIDLGLNHFEVWSGTAWGTPTVIKHAEFTAVTAMQTAGAGVNLGSLAADSARTVNNTFCTVDTTGKATFNEVGVYVCHSKVSPTAGYSTLQLWAFDHSGTQQLAQTGSGYGGLPASGMCTVYVDTPGQTLQFGATWNATSSANCRVKITKLQG